MFFDSMSLHMFSGPVFGNMDNFTGLGVFVDTYPNEEKHIEVCRTRSTHIPGSMGKQSRVMGKCHQLMGVVADLCKGIVFVLFCATIWRQAQKKRYTPRTQVIRPSV